MQANHGHNLGNIDPALYTKLGPAGAKDSVLDIVCSTNQLNPVVSSVPGFTAAPGYDVRPAGAPSTTCRCSSPIWSKP